MSASVKEADIFYYSGLLYHHQMASSSTVSS